MFLPFLGFVIIGILMLQSLGLIDLLPDIAQGGIILILFVIWWYTFHRANQQYDNSIKYALDLFAKSETHANELFKLSLAKHEELNARLIDQMKEYQNIIKDGHDLQRHTTGVLSRLETKIDKL